MAVRSKLLGAAIRTAAGIHVMYTVPVGRTALIKSIIIGNNGPSTFWHLWVESPSGQQWDIARETSQATTTLLYRTPNMVIPEGWSIRVDALATPPAGQDIRFIVAGAELLGVAT